MYIGNNVKKIALNWEYMVVYIGGSTVALTLVSIPPHSLTVGPPENKRCLKYLDIDYMERILRGLRHPQTTHASLNLKP